MQLGSNGVGLEAVRTALAGANANRPKGAFQDADHRWQISDNDQIFKASDYAPIIAGYNKQTGAPVRIADLGTVTDSVSDIRTAGVSGHQSRHRPPGKLKDAILIIIFKIPGANVISTVDSVMAEMPRLQAAIPPTIKINVAVDRTTTIRSSVRDVEISLLHQRDAGGAGGLSLPARGVGHHHSFRRRAALAGGHLRRHVPARLHHRQPLADGADHRHRLCGGRRHRGHREHHPLSRNGHEALRSGHEGLEGDRLHRALHEHLADRRLHSHSADGRHRRQALPRVRRYAFGGHRRLAAGLADHHAHALRPVSQVARREPPRPHLSRQRARLPLAARRIRRRPALGVAPPVC